MKSEEVDNEHITNADLRIDEYPFTIRRLTEDEGTGYIIEYPDFSVCISDGATPEEAIVNGKDALRAVLLTLMEFGHPIPEPGSSTRLSPELRERLEKKAMAEGKSVESLLAAIVEESLAA
jgi:antitoxin HicB